MKYGKVLVTLVALLALALVASVSASGLGSIQSVEVNGVEAVSGASVAVFAGETLPVKVTFNTVDEATDVRMKVWISGAKEYSYSSDRFDVLSNRTYSRTVSVKVPFDIDPSENLGLKIQIEGRNGEEITIVPLTLAAQRESYLVEVLDVAMDTKVTAGQVVPVDVVLKNRGRHFAEDSFVKATIPALGIEGRAYFGDLAPVDQAHPDKEDAVEGRMYLRIPRDAPAGIYLVEIQAYTDDSTAIVTKKVIITGAEEHSMVVSNANSKTFAAGTESAYTLTLVNSGNNIQVYNLDVVSSTGLNVKTDSNVIAIPAGSSKTVVMTADAKKAGDYTFSVNVMSNGQLVKKESYSAKVEGSKSMSGNATVLLTVILAIVFIVLLVVLIVLLTRKPQKSEEFGESYY